MSQGDSEATAPDYEGTRLSRTSTFATRFIVVLTCLLAFCSWGNDATARSPGKGRDAFGAAVCRLDGFPAGEGPRMVVGAPRLSGEGGLASGGVVVCHPDSGKVVQSIAGDKPGEMFGASLAAIPDMDGDGVEELAVGCPGVAAIHGSTSPEGRVRIYSGKTLATLRTIQGKPGDGEFGRKLLVLERGGKPGEQILLIASTGVRGRGRIMAVSPTTGSVSWAMEGKNDNGQLGCAIAVGPDADGDGVLDVLVGAPGEGAETGAAGKLLMVSGADGSVLRTFSGAQAGEGFGSSCVFVDVPAFGATGLLLVGSPDFIHDGKRMGRVQVLDGESGKALKQWQGEKVGGGFGLGVAVWVNSGRKAPAEAEILVGSPTWSEGTVMGGRVDVFSAGTGDRVSYALGRQDLGGFGSVLQALPSKGGSRGLLAIGAPGYLFVSGKGTGSRSFLWTVLAGDILDGTPWLAEGAVDEGRKGEFVGR